jgi:hypothetical protein
MKQGEENCRCQNHFGMDDWAIRLAKNKLSLHFVPDVGNSYLWKFYT